MARLSWHKLHQVPALTIAIIILLDQSTKLLILSTEELRQGGSIWVIPHYFRIVFVCNSGAAWGMFSDHTTVLTIISAIVLVALLAFFTKFTDGLTERSIAISLMTAGIGGNFIDRIAHRCVVDFLSFSYGTFEWPAFNVADSAICVGVAIYLISSLARPDVDTENKTAAVSET